MSSLSGAGGNRSMRIDMDFKAHTQEANRELQRLQGQIKGTGQAAAAAQKELDRMGKSGTQRAGVPGGGSSMATAHAATLAAAGQPQASYTPASSWMPGTPNSRWAEQNRGEMAQSFAAGAGVVAAFAAAVEGATAVIRRAAGSVDATGRPITGPRSYVGAVAGTMNDIPLVGNVFRAGGSLAEMRLYGQAELRSTAAAEREARLRAAGVPIEAEHVRAMRDLQLDAEGRGRSATLLDAHAAAERRRLLGGGIFGLARRGRESLLDPAQAAAEDAVRRAERGVAGASMADRAAAQQAREAEAIAGGDYRRAALMRRNLQGGTLDEMFSGFGSLPGQRASIQRDDLKRVEQQSLTSLANAQEALNARKRTGVELAQKELELRRAQHDVMKVQASLADQELGRRRGGNQQLALMSDWEKAGLLDAARRLKHLGPEALAKDELAQLAGLNLIAPWVGEKLDAAGERDPFAKAFLEIAGQKSSAELKKTIEARSTLEVTVVEDEAAAVQKMNRALDAYDERMKRLLMQVIEKRFQRAESELAAANLANRLGN
jgi:hypothetical protein